jgi:outer membrane protein assembly factor BamB
MQVRIEDVLFIGIKGTVLALHRASGQELWRTKLKSCQFVNVMQEGDRIYASTLGEVFCLESASGRILWNNPLKGMGYGLVAFANAPQVPAMQQQIQDDEQAAAAATTTPAPATS